MNTQLYNALVFASKGMPTVESFRRNFAPEGDALLEGLVSNNYAQVEDNHVDIRLEGVKAILDHEGFDPNTGKKR